LGDIPIHHLSDRELLILTYQDVRSLKEKIPLLEVRVRSLETDRDELKGRTDALKVLSYTGAGGGFLGAIATAYHWFQHLGGK
jgi:hypothetical protein